MGETHGNSTNFLRIDMSKFVIACGGTGGHLSPGIAIGQALMKAGNDVVFVISQKEIDSKLMAKYKDFKVVKTAGTPFSVSPIKLLKFLFSQTKAVFQMLSLLRREKCDVAISFGGFTSMGLSLAAAILKIPLVLHESNRKAGKAIRVLGRFARRVYVPHGVNISRGKSGIIKHAGYPIRQEIRKISQRSAKEFFGFAPDADILLILGGSQGAAVLNSWAEKNFPELAKNNIDVLCVCGPGKNGRDDYSLRGSDGKIHRIKYLEFCDNMNAALSCAHLAVARAGAGTIAEFARCGLPSILVPYPHSADNHQLENAKCFEKQGGTVLVRQADIGTLLNEVLSMMKNENLRKAMLKNLERVDSLNDMAKIVEDLTFIANNPH